MTEFCSELATNEPLAGSAAHAEKMLLLRWPRGRWSRAHGTAPDMPQALQDKLEAIAAAGRRVNLIDRQGIPEGNCRLILIPEYRCIEVAPADVLATIARWQAGDLRGFRDQPTPLLLVCTHSQREPCCALHGEAVFRALDAAEPPGEVWRSTHLGGCRFSATVLTLPAGRKYGRMRAADVPMLLQAEVEGRPYLPAYRGRIALSEAAQCVEVAALQWADATDGRLVADPVEVEGAWQVSAVENARPVTLHFALDALSFDSPDTCRKLDAGECSPRQRLTARLQTISPQYPPQ